MDTASLALALFACIVAAYAVKRTHDALDALVSQLEVERARHRDEVAELTNKIQHPSVFQLTPRQTEQVAPEPPAAADDFELAGHILGDPDVPPEGTPLPVGEGL